MNEKPMTYKRVRRSIIAMVLCSILIVVSLTFCSSRTDWKPNSVSNFEPAYYNKCRGDILDQNGKVLATTVIERRKNDKGEEINKNKYHRVYNIGPEYANVIGSIVNLLKRQKNKETGKWIYRPDTQGPEGGERAFARWLLTGDDPTSNTGGSIVLTIDSSIQKIAYSELVGFRNKYHESQNANKDENDKMDYCSKGAAVVMDIQTGAVIAYADIPSVDYSEITKVKYTDQLIDFKNRYNDKVVFKDGMLYDFCNALNTPGSTFKTISASILCDARVCYSTTKLHDRGVFHYNISDDGKYSMKIYDHDAKYDKKTDTRIPVDKGIINVKTAITESYNVFFAELAKRADSSEYRKIAHDKWHFYVGFRAEEDDLSYKDNSRIRTDFGGIKRPVLNVDNNQLYYDTSYGLGDVLVSPIYTTMATAAIASDSGNLVRPYMVKAYLNNKGKEVNYKTASYGLTQGDVLTKDAVSVEAHDFITDAMKKHSAAKKYKNGILGIKTGTAKLDNKTNISMTGFIEDRNGKPRYAITVCMFEIRNINKKSTLGGGSLASVFYSIADGLRKLPDM